MRPDLGGGQAMATPPRWTKTQFLAWFEQHYEKLVDLTTRLFGAELQACGLGAPDALNNAVERSLRKRRYQRCHTTMRTWFVKDTKWMILDALREAERALIAGTLPAVA
jgi:DNA-directed RNA polymerase specialized sigma24 family protein